MRNLSMIILMICSLTVQAIPRYALVIGNSHYNSQGQKGYLSNPVNDAKDMTALLSKQLGFTVIEGYDINKMEFYRLIQKFNQLMRKSNSPAVALFYFSGHGFSGKDQSDNDTNYLVPLWLKNAPPRDQISLEDISISSNYIVKGMRRYNKKGTNIMVLDACRGLPQAFVQNYQEEEKDGNHGGFVNMDSRGIFLAYATALGRCSYGSSYTRNSIYTGKLLEVLSEKQFLSKNITEVFNETALRVAKITQHYIEPQEPWFSGSGVRFCFGTCWQPDVSRLEKKAQCDHKVNFPKRIVYKIFDDKDRQVGECTLTFSKNGYRQRKNKTYTFTLSDFEGLGFSSDENLLTNIHKTDLSISSIFLTKKGIRVPKFQARVIDGGGGIKRTYRFISQNQSGTVDIGLKHKIIDLLSSFVMASQMVRNNQTEADFYFLIKEIPRVVKMKTLKGEKLQIGKISVGTVPVSILHQPKGGTPQEIIRFYIDNKDYYPIQVTFPHGKGVITLRQHKKSIPPSAIYVTNLSFSNTHTKNIMVQTEKSKLINEAILDGIERAQN